MIIVVRHECATLVYSAHPIDFSTSGMKILQIALFLNFRVDTNVLRLRRFLVMRSTGGTSLPCYVGRGGLK